MGDACLCFIREALHLHEVDRVKLDFVPNVQHDVELHIRVTFLMGKLLT